MSEGLILQPAWEFVADGVMGGISQGAVRMSEVSGRHAARLTGSVSLENNGGFLQMAFDLAGGAVLDASRFEGLALDAWGNEQDYEVRLRTDQLMRPWQSYRAVFRATPRWQRIELPFARFAPNKTDIALDPARLRRIGVLAVGRAFAADVAVARVAFYA